MEINALHFEEPPEIRHNYGYGKGEGDGEGRGEGKCRGVGNDS